MDDGVRSRGHRKNCFSSDFVLVGMGSCDHRSYKKLCVMDFAEEFTPKDGGASDKTPKAKNKKSY